MNDNFPTAVAGWLHYFRGNASRGQQLTWQDEVVLGAKMRRALARTLQRFHLGESGEGRFLKEWAERTGDGLYCEAIALFVAEEQEHSRWFGLLLDNLNVPRLESHWSDAIFTFVRRLGGLHFELITFLTAEIIGQRLFAYVARCAVRRLFALSSRASSKMKARILLFMSLRFARHLATKA